MGDYDATTRPLSHNIPVSTTESKSQSFSTDLKSAESVEVRTSIASAKALAETATEPKSPTPNFQAKIPTDEELLALLAQAEEQERNIGSELAQKKEAKLKDEKIYAQAVQAQKDLKIDFKKNLAMHGIKNILIFDKAAGAIRRMTTDIAAKPSGKLDNLMIMVGNKLYVAPGAKAALIAGFGMGPGGKVAIPGHGGAIIDIDPDDIEELTEEELGEFHAALTHFLEEHGLVGKKDKKDEEKPVKKHEPDHLKPHQAPEKRKPVDKMKDVILSQKREANEAFEAQMKQLAEAKEAAYKRKIANIREEIFETHAKVKEATERRKLRSADMLQSELTGLRRHSYSTSVSDLPGMRSVRAHADKRFLD